MGEFTSEELRWPMEQIGQTTETNANCSNSFTYVTVLPPACSNLELFLTLTLSRENTQLGFHSGRKVYEGNGF